MSRPTTVLSASLPNIAFPITKITTTFMIFQKIAQELHKP
jgi:hypothetical protein